MAVSDKKMRVSQEEAAAIDIMRFNKAEKRREVSWRKQIGRLKIHYNWRSRKNLWRRFGGGWNWKLGFQAASRCIIINLLVCSLRLEIVDRKGE